MGYHMLIKKIRTEFIPMPISRSGEGFKTFISIKKKNYSDGTTHEFVWRIASAIMICLEIWYFMTIIVLTGHLDNPVIVVEFMCSSLPYLLLY